MLSRLLIAVPLMLAGSTAPGASASCDRMADAFKRTAQAVEATVQRWTDCLGAGRQCDAEHKDAVKAQNAVERAWAETKRQCPDLTR
jgi:hypothetical protein